MCPPHFEIVSVIGERGGRQGEGDSQGRCLFARLVWSQLLIILGNNFHLVFYSFFPECGEAQPEPPQVLHARGERQGRGLDGRRAGISQAEAAEGSERIQQVIKHPDFFKKCRAICFYFCFQQPIQEPPFPLQP